MRHAAVADDASGFGHFGAHFGQISVIEGEEVVFLRREGHVQRSQILHRLRELLVQQQDLSLATVFQRVELKEQKFEIRIDYIPTL